MSESSTQPQGRSLEEGLLVRMVVFTSILAVLAVIASLIFILAMQYPSVFSSQEMIIAESVVTEEVDEDEVENGIDVATGFIAEGDYLLVKRNCTACHSAKLVMQNRATKEGWLEMIRWMQATQKLWDLGKNEDKIIEYLATYYGPQKKGRRAPIQVDEWYMIE